MLSSPRENDDDDGGGELTRPCDVSSSFPVSVDCRCIATLRGHTSFVAALAVHGGCIYSGGSDQEIKLWSPSSSDDDFTSFTVVKAKSPVKSLVVSGENLFSSHQDGKILVWRMGWRDGRRRLYKLRAALPTAADRLVRSLSPENYVEVRRHKKRTWVHHVDAVSGIALSHDGELMYSVSWDRSLKAWHTAGGGFRCMESVAGAHRDAINAVAVSCGGEVYTASADGRINVWRREDGGGRHALVQSLERHAAAVNALALSEDGRVLYSGGCDRAVVAWEGGSGGRRMEPAGELRGHKRAVLCLAASAAGEVVCSGSADATVRAWRIGGDEQGRRCYWCLAVLEGHEGPVKSLAMALTAAAAAERSEGCSTSWSAECMVYSGGLDCDIKVWRLLVPLPNLLEENIS